MSNEEARRHLSTLQLLSAIVVIGVGFYLARPVLIPMSLALLVVITVLPIVRLLRGFGVPRLLALLLVITAFLGMTFGLGQLAMNSLLEVRSELPRFAEEIESIQAQVTERVNEIGLDVPDHVIQGAFNPEWLFDSVGLMVRTLASMAQQTLFILLLAAFMLVEAYHLPKKLKVIFSTPSGAFRMERLQRMVTQVQQYLLVKTGSSLLTGFLVSGFAYLVGLDFAILLGLIAFVLNYVPTIGSVVAAIPAVALALLSGGVGTVLVVAGFYLGINLLIGNLLEPAVQGRQLGLSTFAVVLSLFVWGALWGPIGAFLAVPLTMVTRILVENSRELGWFSVLLGSIKELPNDPEVA